MSFENYEADAKTRSAVERQLILTEAAIRLGDQADILCPGIDWKGVRGMGNILRHDYHRVANEIVWNTVKLDLPLVKHAVEKTLGNLA